MERYLLFGGQGGFSWEVLTAADRFGKLPGLHRLKVDPPAQVIEPLAATETFMREIRLIFCFLLQI